MDPIQLTHDLSQALEPALPLLVTAGNSLTEIVTTRTFTALERWAARVWQALRRNGAPRSDALEAAARDLVEHPADEDARAALRLQLRKVIETDPALARELEQLLEDGYSSGVLVAATGSRSVAAGGGINQSTIVTGDQNIVRE